MVVVRDGNEARRGNIYLFPGLIVFFFFIFIKEFSLLDFDGLKILDSNQNLTFLSACVIS